MPDDANDNLPEKHTPAKVSAGWFPLLLKRNEQALIAGMCLVAIALLGGYWCQQQSRRGGLIEIDLAKRQHAAFQVDINQAEWAELSQLPGIGETIARRIVDSRELQGPFTSREDLQRVNGIGPKTMERLKPYLLPLAEQGTVAGDGVSKEGEL